MKLESDYFVHIDADMLVVPHDSKPISSLLEQEEVGLVEHPGYWRVNFPEKFFFYSSNLKFLLKDILLLIRNGNLGTWSKNKKSKAFVSRVHRKKYFCGAVWFGKKDAILKLAYELATFTDLDLQCSYIPSWNDESYLNWYASGNKHNELSPLFCSDGKVDQLFVEKPYIKAVHKPIQGYHGN